MEVEQRSTAIAWINRRVRLDEVVVGACANDPAFSTGNSSCHCLPQPEGVTDGDDPLAHPQLVGVTQWCHGEVPLRFDLDQRYLRLGVAPNHLGIKLF
jgi:hypothetical protein